MYDEALSHIRVLDLTHHVAGPFCTKMLADYGAQVIKVERPSDGDMARRLGPFLKDHPHPEKSGTFLHLNTNKLGITLNIKSPAGIGIFKELVNWADVVVENFRPGVMERLGLPYSRLRELKPNLIMVSISNFGQSGPYRDYRASEIVEYAIGGPMLFTGTKKREPLKLVSREGLCTAGQIAALATLMAVYCRDSDGSGDHIDVSIMDTEAGSIDRQSTLLLSHQYMGKRWSRFDTDKAALFGLYRSKDGYIDVGVRNRLPGFLTMLKRPELAEDPRFASEETLDEPGNAKALDEILKDWLSQHARTEIWRESQKHRILAAPLFNMAEVLEDGHFRGRGFWTEVERRQVGTLEYPGRPFVMNASPWRLRMPAPLLGQHNKEVFQGMLGYSSPELVRLRQMKVI
ncbi:MAG: CaiB/BaiF CoA transferase family protein [Dehalococcoidia bacterium]